MPLSKLLGVYGAQRAAGVSPLECPTFDELVGRVADLMILSRRADAQPELHAIVYGRRA